MYPVIERITKTMRNKAYFEKINPLTISKVHTHGLTLIVTDSALLDDITVDPFVQIQAASVSLSVFPDPP